MKLSNQEKIIAELVQKTWHDSEFKAELLANPIAAIEKETGAKVELPAGMEIVVTDQSATDTIYFNIPRSGESVELTDDQLEAVAGGNTEPSGSTHVTGGCGNPSDGWDKVIKDADKWINRPKEY